MKHDIDSLLPCHWILMEASGRLGRHVFYMRGTRIRIRTHVIPANPRTARQQEGRARFAGAVKSWQALDAEAKRAWNARVNKKNQNMTGYHLFISEYMNSEAMAGTVPEKRATPAPAPRPRAVILTRTGKKRAGEPVTASAITTTPHRTIDRRAPDVYYEPRAA